MKHSNGKQLVKGKKGGGCGGFGGIYGRGCRLQQTKYPSVYSLSKTVVTEASKAIRTRITLL